jgi:hypothetical protein
MVGQLERLAAAVVLEASACEEAVLFQPGEELRDGGRRDGGTPGQLGTYDLSFLDRLQRQVLHDRERRVVRGEQALDPAADERRRPRERLRRLTAAGVLTRP